MPGTATAVKEQWTDTMDVFAPLRPAEVRSLAGPALEILVPAGQRLTCEGRVIGTFFVIRSGTADLCQDDRVIATLEIGDCFGEIQPVMAHPQRFSVVASSPLRLVTFSAFGIARLCSAIPRVRERILLFLPQ